MWWKFQILWLKPRADYIKTMWEQFKLSATIVKQICKLKPQVKNKNATILFKNQIIWSNFHLLRLTLWNDHSLVNFFIQIKSITLRTMSRQLKLALQGKSNKRIPPESQVNKSRTKVRDTNNPWKLQSPHNQSNNLSP